VTSSWFIIPQLLPSNYIETSTWHARPFVSAFYRPAHGLVAW